MAGWFKYPLLWSSYLIAASIASDVRRSFRHSRDYGVQMVSGTRYLVLLRAHPSA